MAETEAEDDNKIGHNNYGFWIIIIKLQFRE